MATNTNIQEFAPRAPGHILAPTVFRIDGDADDYTDWYPDEDDEDGPDGTARDGADSSCLPFCWLLVFRTFVAEEAGAGGKDGQLVRLVGEFAMDMLGRIRQVPMSHNWSKDVREVSKRVLDSNLLPWGWRYPDSHRPPFQMFDYWVLCSPFQLAWSSLPPLDPKHHACTLSQFSAWADNRGLSKVSLSADDILSKIRQGPIEVPVIAAWREGFLRNRAVVRALDRKRVTAEQAKERLLYQLVDIVRRENPSVQKCLRKGKIGELDVDQLEIDIFAGKLALEAELADQELDDASTRFLEFLDGKAYATLKRDAEQSRDSSRNARLLMILDRIYRGTIHAPVVFRELEKNTSAMNDFLSNHYDWKTDFKAYRKAAKSYWSLVKLFLEVGAIKTGVPKWVLQPSQSFAKTWYGRELKAIPGTKPGTVVFDKSDVEHIRNKSTSSLSHLHFFFFLEILNIAFASKELLESASKKKLPTSKVLSLLGALFSGASGILELRKRFDAQMAAKAAAKGEAFVPGLVGRVAARKASTKILGMGASAVDVVSGSLALGADSDVRDNTAAAFHVAQIVGGAVSFVGYALLCFGVTAPIGALCVLLGTVVGMGASIGASVYKSTEMENWIKFCQWGILAGDKEAGNEPQSWSDGPPKDLHKSVSRQLDTLNKLLLGLRIEGELVFEQIRNPSLDVSVACNLLSEDACISLEVVVDGKMVRKLAPWKQGKDQPGSDGAYHERFEVGDATRAVLRVQVDMFGDKSFWVPPKGPVEKPVLLMHPRGTWANPIIGRPF